MRGAGLKKLMGRFPLAARDRAQLELGAGLDTLLDVVASGPQQRQLQIVLVHLEAAADALTPKTTEHERRTRPR